MQTLEDLLVGSRFFQGLQPELLQLIAGCGSNMQFEAGAYLFHEGDPSDRFYLVRHGKVALEIWSPNRGPVTISTVGEGDLIGWSWLVPPHHTRSDARALEPTRVTSFDGACIRAKCESDPQFGYELLKRIAQVIGRRLQDMQLQLLDVYGTYRGAGNRADTAAVPARFRG